MKPPTSTTATAPEKIGIMSIYEITNLLGLKHLSDYKWEGTYSTGKFDAIHDYDVGLLSVFMSIGVNEEDHTRFSIMFGIYNTDDGGWQAYNPQISYATRLEASEELDKMALTFISYMEKHHGLVLPTEKELNTFLQQFNLWGEYTG